MHGELFEPMYSNTKFAPSTRAPVITGMIGWARSTRVERYKPAQSMIMERLHSLLRRHWHHEPTPNPSQEGNFRGAGECLLPSWEGSGVGRFMENLFVRMSPFSSAG